MNKSIEFIKRRIKECSKTAHNMPTIGWDEVCVFNPLEQFKLLFGNSEVIKDDSNEFSLNINTESIDGSQSGTIKVTVEYNPDAEFEYFTNTSSTHDGTFVFIGDNIHRLLEKLIFLQTQNKHKITEEFEKDIFSHRVKYTIGDIVMHSDFGTKEINGHKMMGQTDILCLPIKFEVFKSESN